MRPQRRPPASNQKSRRARSPRETRHKLTHLLNNKGTCTRTILFLLESEPRLLFFEDRLKQDLIFFLRGRREGFHFEQSKKNREKIRIRQTSFFYVDFSCMNKWISNSKSSKASFHRSSGGVKHLVQRLLYCCCIAWYSGAALQKTREKGALIAKALSSKGSYFGAGGS